MNHIQLSTHKKHIRKARLEKKQLKVCITGGSKGLGKNMTKHFLDKGDKVFVVSRDVCELCDVPNLYSYATDIGKSDNISPLFEKVLEDLDGEIDIFVNCAAISGGFKSFETQTPDKLEEIIQTNLLGTTLCTFYAYNIMKSQESGGAIYNLLGNGSNGFATPKYAMYGGTKSAIKQFTKSIQNEWCDSKVDMHLISPGLMITDLLMDNMDDKTFDIIKNVCSTPDLVAYHIVPRIRRVYYAAEDNKTIKFQTIGKIIYKMIAGTFK